ncbi:MAG: hypothetical protein IPJ85_05095 [Flavobacteriales bacterium]|nr:hypothetical protein [Flavobacteriales bacterium]
MRSGVLRRAGLVLLLLLPAVLFYWAHFRPKDPRLIPTGFVQYDQPYYMANARQYLDGRSDGWRYALPFSPSAAATPAHFQPQTMLLAGLWRITGADPGKLFVAFGAAAAIVFVLLSVCLLDQVLERTAPVLLTVVFVWGGGLLALAGFSISMLQDMDWRMAALSAFRFDPGDGWWFLNLGRNLIFPMGVLPRALLRCRAAALPQQALAFRIGRSGARALASIHGQRGASGTAGVGHVGTDRASRSHSERAMGCVRRGSAHGAHGLAWLRPSAGGRASKPDAAMEAALAH